MKRDEGTSENILSQCYKLLEELRRLRKELQEVSPEKAPLPIVPQEVISSPWEKLDLISRLLIEAKEEIARIAGEITFIQQKIGMA